MPIPAPHTDQLPAGDADFADYLTAFAGAWLPATFNVVTPLALTLTTSASSFVTALALSTVPATRTSVTIAAKDLARRNAAILFRSAIRAAQTAFLNGSATGAQLITLGVRPNDLLRSPIGAPIFAPLIGVDASFAGQIRFRLTQVDPLTGLAVTTRKFAYGIIGIQLERRVGVAAFILRKVLKRTSFQDPSNDLPPGAIADFRVRYITARGLVSPWSSVVSGVVQ